MLSPSFVRLRFTSRLTSILCFTPSPQTHLSCFFLAMDLTRSPWCINKKCRGWGQDAAVCLPLLPSHCFLLQHRSSVATVPLRIPAALWSTSSSAPLFLLLFSLSFSSHPSCLSSLSVLFERLCSQRMAVLSCLVMNILVKPLPRRVLGSVHIPRCARCTQRPQIIPTFPAVTSLVDTRDCQSHTKPECDQKPI